VNHFEHSVDVRRALEAHGALALLRVRRPPGDGRGSGGTSDGEIPGWKRLRHDLGARSGFEGGAGLAVQLPAVEL
jgi:hypothetical protein